MNLLLGCFLDGGLCFVAAAGVASAVSWVVSKKVKTQCDPHCLERESGVLDKGPATYAEHHRRAEEVRRDQQHEDWLNDNGLGGACERGPDCDGSCLD